MSQDKASDPYEEAVLSDLLDELGDAVVRTCNLVHDLAGRAETSADRQVTVRLQEVAARLRAAMLELERQS
ncbi:hypothetical protein [Novosphingobium cyanobacteriorum]|uniref:Histidine kinase n=1 Tax=Novosphingobium cyanobacteriorum TaxID=3024215 RepID=A0ABT6CNQ8_9SPHN|nr:hypothetical protein [Novosphingobium cyanobacteriorum]MDF8335542.1 hypothetical protein [Novosphingobium cyanobacteriorum]